LNAVRRGKFVILYKTKSSKSDLSLISHYYSFGTPWKENLNGYLIFLFKFIMTGGEIE